MDPLEAISLVDTLFNLCTIIRNLFSNMKANKERCKRLSQRIAALQDLFLIIKKRGPGQISASVFKALQELEVTLTDARVSLIKYSQTKGIRCLIKASSFEGKFYKINESLNDNFQYLSGALHVEQGDVLHKVYQTVLGQRQDEERGYRQASTTPLPPTAAPNIVPVTPVNIPPPYTPAPNKMPPGQMFTATYVIPPQPVLTSLPGTMAPMAVPPVFIPPNIIPGPVVRTIAPVQAAVLGTYTINKTYFV